MVNALVDGCLDGVHFGNNGLGLSSGSLDTVILNAWSWHLWSQPAYPPVYTFAWCPYPATWSVLAGLAGFWSLTSSDLACHVPGTSRKPLMVSQKCMDEGQPGGGVGRCAEQCLKTLEGQPRAHPPFSILLSRGAGSLPLTTSSAFSFMKKIIKAQMRLAEFLSQ